MNNSCICEWLRVIVEIVINIQDVKTGLGSQSVSIYNISHHGNR